MAASEKTDITSLPTELLEHIFLLATSPEPFRPPYYMRELSPAQRGLTRQGSPHDPFTLLALLRVCKRSQQIALSCPALWSYFSLDMHGIPWIERALPLSSCAPLTIRAADSKLISYLPQLGNLLKLITAEPHRIRSLTLSSDIQTAIEEQHYLRLSEEFPQLKEIKFEVPLALSSPWLPLLNGASNLAVLDFAGMSSSADLQQLASTLHFTGLKTLALQGKELSSRIKVDASALLALLRKLPNLETIFLNGVDLSGEEAVPPCIEEITLPRLRDLQVMWCSSSIFRVLQNIALPRGTRVDVRLEEHIQPHYTDAFLDFMARIGSASHEAGTLRSLRVCHEDACVLSLLGYRTAAPTDDERADLRVEFWRFDGDGPGDDTSLFSLFIRALARLHLYGVRTLTLAAYNDGWEPHALFTALRPVFAGLVHVQALRTEGLLSKLSMTSVVDLLTKRHEGNVPLPSLASVLFDAADVCPGYGDAFFDELRALLLARWKLGAPVHRVVVRSEEEEIFTDDQKMVLRTARATGVKDNSRRLVRYFATENVPARSDHVEALPCDKRTATRTRGKLCSCDKIAKDKYRHKKDLL